MKKGTKEGSHPFNTIKEVEFKVLGKKFRLILHPHRDVLHSNFRAYSRDGDGKETVVHLNHDNFFNGRVFGEMESHVNAHIENGVMTASVVLPDETYHIEPSWRHLSHLTDKHMIAYKASDVKLSWNNGDSGTDIAPVTCGFVKEGLELETDDDDEEYHDDQHEPQSMWSAQNTNHNENEEKEKIVTRSKRQADQYEYTPTKTRCPLLLVADYRFFQEMGGSNTKTTINYLISLIDRVHKIYNDTIWQDRSVGFLESLKNYLFQCHIILIHRIKRDSREWDSL